MDIATGLSNALTRDGQAGMTAAFKAISGSITAPSITFNSDSTTGLYLPSTGILGLVSHSLGLKINSQVFQTQTATVAAGGSGYVVGDTIYGPPTNSTRPFCLTVATLSGTAVATVTITVGGIYIIKPANPVAQFSTSGVGTGATFNFTWNDPALADYRLGITNLSDQAPWGALGASSFVANLLPLGNGVDFVTAIGAANVTNAIGLSAPPPGSSFKNLSIQVGSGTLININADFVVVTNGPKYQTLLINATLNMGTNGVNALDTGAIGSNSWYAIYAIAKSDGTSGTLASLSGTSPTMPAGYTFKARIGWVRTLASALWGTLQLGRTAQWLVGIAQTAALPTMVLGAYGNPNTPVYGNVLIANFVPPTASKIMVLAQNANLSASTSILAPNPNYGAYGSLTNPPFYSTQVAGGGSFTGVSSAVTMILESANIYWATSSASSGLYAAGWEDNL